MFGEIRLVHTPGLKTGDAALTGDTLLIGTGPLNAVELAGYEARYMVNRGLRDVVEWLGEVPLPRNPANVTMQLLRQTHRRNPRSVFTDGSVI